MYTNLHKNLFGLLGSDHFFIWIGFGKKRKMYEKAKNLHGLHCLVSADLKAVQNWLLEFVQLNCSSKLLPICCNVKKLSDKYMWEAGCLTAAELRRCFPCKTAQNPANRSLPYHLLLSGSRTVWGTFRWMLTRFLPDITWKTEQEWFWWRVVVAPSPAILPSRAAARLPAPGALGCASEILVENNHNFVLWKHSGSTAGSVYALYACALIAFFTAFQPL